MFFNSKKNDDDNVLPIIENIAFASTILFGGYSLKIIISKFANELMCFAGITLGFIGSVTSSVWLVSYFVYKPQYIDDEELVEETEYNKYISFINKDYDTLIQIYKDNNESNYSTATEIDIAELKKKENHQTFTLPYSYNLEMKFFYNDENKYFCYYSKTDVNGKILNSICRSYTLLNNCLHLFKDEEEILYIKNQSKCIKNESKCEKNKLTDIHDLSDSLIDDDEKSDSEENTDGFVNIFYKKKNNKKEPLQQVTNNFLYKGTLIDYQKEYTTKPVEKYTSYQDYIEKLKD